MAFVYLLIQVVEPQGSNQMDPTRETVHMTAWHDRKLGRLQTPVGIANAIQYMTLDWTLPRPKHGAECDCGV